jgi:hypothetical protein
MSPNLINQIAEQRESLEKMPIHFQKQMIHKLGVYLKENRTLFESQMGKKSVKWELLKWDSYSNGTYLFLKLGQNQKKTPMEAQLYQDIFEATQEFAEKGMMTHQKLMELFSEGRGFSKEYWRNVFIESYQHSGIGNYFSIFSLKGIDIPQDSTSEFFLLSAIHDRFSRLFDQYWSEAVSSSAQKDIRGLRALLRRPDLSASFRKRLHDFIEADDQVWLQFLVHDVMVTPDPSERFGNDGSLF